MDKLAKLELDVATTKVALADGHKLADERYQTFCLQFRDGFQTVENKFSDFDRKLSDFQNKMFFAVSDPTICYILLLTM